MGIQIGLVRVKKAAILLMFLFLLSSGQQFEHNSWSATILHAVTKEIMNRRLGVSEKLQSSVVSHAFDSNFIVINTIDAPTIKHC